MLLKHKVITGSAFEKIYKLIHNFKAVEGGTIASDNVSFIILFIQSALKSFQHPPHT